jgi:hypothetical protein
MINNINICIKCNDIPINKTIQEWNECYECCQDDRPFNINRKNKSKCECLKININIFFCNNCKIQVYKCKDCLNYYEKNKFYYNSCIECLKNNNPSDDNNIYEWNDNNKLWKLIKISKECTICNINYYKDNDINKINICIQCQLNKLQKKYNYMEFNINNENIIFRKKCICNNYTEYIETTYIDTLIQCKNCNPSSTYKIYEYSNFQHVWYINKIGKKCNLCDNILWKNENIGEYWGDLIQCRQCIPINNYIKYKFINTGYKIDKIKFFNGNKHVWKNPISNIDINYKCICVKCLI